MASLAVLSPDIYSFRGRSYWMRLGVIGSSSFRRFVGEVWRRSHWYRVGGVILEAGRLIVEGGPCLFASRRTGRCLGQEVERRIGHDHDGDER